MQLLLCDETNTQPSDQVKFLIYGGLVLPEQRLEELHKGISEIRRRAGYRPGDELKFDTRSRPEWVSKGDFHQAKREVLELCQALECKLIASVILHDIIRKLSAEERLCWAANYVLGRFNFYLRSIGETGRCIMDRMPVKDPFAYPTAVLVHGLSIQPEGRKIPLDLVECLPSSLQTCPALSAIDIALGAFRYCVNGPNNREAAREMILSLAKLLLHNPATGSFSGYGLIYRPDPASIRRPGFREEYRRMRCQLKALLVEATGQPPAPPTD